MSTDAPKTTTIKEERKSEPNFTLRQFYLSSSPHFHHKQSVPNIMWTVVVALTPCISMSVLLFGFGVILTMLASILAAIITEETINKLRKKPSSIKDGSAIITGLVLALSLPPTLSPFFAALGSIVAIGLGKQVFGGLGYNIFNPALLGRAFLQASFPIHMTTWTTPLTADAVTAATPLGSFKFERLVTPYYDLFMGNIGGCIGETSALAIIIGGAFLIVRQAVDWRIPVSYLSTVALISGAFWIVNPEQYPDPIFHLLSGGLLFGAFFMATDMVTTPITIKGSWIFGIGAGLILVIIRLFGGLPEGVMFSILLMNGCTPLINRFTRPKFFGERV